MMSNTSRYSCSTQTRSPSRRPTGSSKDKQMNLAIPPHYKIVQTLGSGISGTVYMCRRRGTDEVLAVKTPHSGRLRSLRYEASVYRKLMEHNLDHANIVTFHGELLYNDRVSLKFEALDITMLQYLVENGGRRMQLQDVRRVIQQLAESFNVLRQAEVIHTDVKVDNIMFVDHIKEPFKVKLIDFGLALTGRSFSPRKVQPVANRAPEVMLWLPFSEAIDIWSLGCVMGEMLFGSRLFPSSNERQVMQFIVDLLGPPPQKLMEALKKQQNHFRKDGESWLLKTPALKLVDKRRYSFRRLDEMKTERLEWCNLREAEDRGACIELLKAMLQWDPQDRISPQDILRHPFITRSYVESHPGLPPTVILVRPALPENQIDSTGMGDAANDAVVESARNDRLKKQRTEEDGQLEAEDVRGNNQDPPRTSKGKSHEPLTHLTQSSPEPPREKTDSKNRRSPKKKEKNRLQHICSWFRKKLPCCASNREA